MAHDGSNTGYQPPTDLISSPLPSLHAQPDDSASTNVAGGSRPDLNRISFNPPPPEDDEEEEYETDGAETIGYYDDAVDGMDSDHGRGSMFDQPPMGGRDSALRSEQDDRYEDNEDNVYFGDGVYRDDPNSRPGNNSYFGGTAYDDDHDPSTAYYTPPRHENDGVYRDIPYDGGIRW